MSNHTAFDSGMQPEPHTNPSTESLPEYHDLSDRELLVIMYKALNWYELIEYIDESLDPRADLATYREQYPEFVKLRKALTAFGYRWAAASQERGGEHG